MAYTDPGGGGVGGWLAFFVIILVVLTPLGSIVGIAQLYADPQIALTFGPHWPAIQTLELTLVAVVIAGAWYLAWLLNYRQHWRTVRIVIPGIWLLAVGSLVAEFVGVSLIAGVPLGLMIDEGRLEFIRPFIFGGIWTAYFLRSERVANTYPRELEARDVAGVFE